MAPYRDLAGGHRIGFQDGGDVMSHARGVFEQGLQLEAILLAHEHLEQRLNAAYRRRFSPADTIYRRYKQLIDIFRSQGMLSEQDYLALNEFNRLRNVNSNQILNPSLTLRGAKKGDMEKTMALAQECDHVVTGLLEAAGSQKKKGGKKKNRPSKAG